MGCLLLLIGLSVCVMVVGWVASGFNFGVLMLIMVAVLICSGNARRR